MSIEEIKNYSTDNAWNALVKLIPETSEYQVKSVLGKKQSLDLAIKSFEAGKRAISEPLPEKI